MHPDFTVLPTDLPATLVLADTEAAAAWTRTEEMVFGENSVLTEQEQNYAREFDAEAALTWAAGRIVLRHVLGSVLDADPAAIEIRLDSAGKPRVDGTEFSVTRARRLVLVAVAEDPVGVDLEAIPDHAVAVEASALLHPRERAELDALGGGDHGGGARAGDEVAGDEPTGDEPTGDTLGSGALAEAFVRVWARKEAFLKALSTGLARDPGLDYIGTGETPESPHPDIDIHDLVADIPAGYRAAIAFNR